MNGGIFSRTDTIGKTVDSERRQPPLARGMIRGPNSCRAGDDDDDENDDDDNDDVDDDAPVASTARNEPPVVPPRPPPRRGRTLRNKWARGWL